MSYISDKINEVEAEIEKLTNYRNNLAVVDHTFRTIHSIEIDPGAGTWLGNVKAEALLLAKLTNCSVKFNFNDSNYVVTPNG